MLSVTSPRHQYWMSADQIKNCLILKNTRLLKVIVSDFNVSKQICLEKLLLEIKIYDN